MTNNSTNGNFKGKVMYYSNINWQEKKLEKEFDSQDDMNTYMKENDASFPRFFQPTSLGNFWAFDSWFDSFFDRKLTSMWYSPQAWMALWHSDSFSELQRRKAQLEQEEREKEKKKSFLEKRLDEWKELKKFFAGKNDTESVKKAEDWIKECEEQLKSC